MTIIVTVLETATYVTVDETQNTVTLNQSDNPITVNTTTDVLLPASFADQITYEETTTLPGGNVQEALADLAEQFYRQSATPSGSNLGEGDLWYDTANEELRVYRQVGVSSYEWHTIAAAGGTSPTMNTLDGGSF
tara:strand:+ start:200 stop:604 length:405 start_codon:yes stop_codon:yes gene_type:complete